MPRNSSRQIPWTTSGLSWASLLAFFALALGAVAAAFGGHAATQPRYAHVFRRPAAAAH